VSGPDERACNVPGKPPQVAVEETTAVFSSRRINLPPMSASLYELAMRR
jgi:hypothetical protein